MLNASNFLLAQLSNKELILLMEKLLLIGALFGTLFCSHNRSNNENKMTIQKVEKKGKQKKKKKCLWSSRNPVHMQNWKWNHLKCLSKFYISNSFEAKSPHMEEEKSFYAASSDQSHKKEQKKLLLAILQANCKFQRL